jgi:molecular chaperone HscA
MGLLQISEPGQTPAPHQRKRAVGIDLGTTNSLVATVQSGTAETIANEQGEHLLPSVVHYGVDKIEVGLHAKNNAAVDPLNTIISVKRLMGRGITEIKKLGEQLPYHMTVGSGGVPYITPVAGEISPVHVSADILRVLANRGAQALGGELEGVVITVPAYFDDAQRQATKDAAQLAGLNVLRLLNEPTAAAVAYGLDKNAQGVIAIYDLGGGTFDISILQLSKGVFEVLATGGDTALGGDDFDHAIANWIISQAELGNNLNPQQQRELLTKACAAKEMLTVNHNVLIEYGNWQGNLTRDFFHELIDSLIEKTLQSCRRTLRDAKIKIGDISAVVLVGGSTRVPRVREKVAAYFNQQPLADIDPDKVVAIGAAIQADVLVGNKSTNDMLLLDVIPLSLGIETMGGLVEKIISRNTSIPVAKMQEFTTFKDGQTAMMIHVLQGDRELVSDCRSLAQFELHGIPPRAAGAAHIQVLFQVDADGLLNVTAKEKSTGVTSSVVVKPSYGLSDADIARMLQASFTHAIEDKEARSLREQKVEAERLLETLSAALDVDGDALLSQAERQRLQKDIEQVRTAYNEDDIKKLTGAIDLLNKEAESFASRRMDATIKKALSGHTIDDIAER